MQRFNNGTIDALTASERKTGFGLVESCASKYRRYFCCRSVVTALFSSSPLFLFTYSSSLLWPSEAAEVTYTRFCDSAAAAVAPITSSSVASDCVRYQIGCTSRQTAVGDHLWIRSVLNRTPSRLHLLL